MGRFDSLGQRKVVLGMVHLQPLPGTPFHRSGTFSEILRTAVESARSLQAGGADGCLVQTVDRVYTTGEDSDPARTSALALIVNAIVAATDEDFQVGVQVMANALKASLAVAKVAGGTYIRAGAVVGATMSSYGLIEAHPHEVMTYRRSIDAADIKVIAEVDSMHYRWLGAGKSTAEVAGSARRVGADAVAVSHPEESVMLDMIASVKDAVPDLPVILAGNTTHENAARLVAAADGAFVGTCLESGGWGGQIDVEKVKAYVDIVRSLE